MPWPEALWAQRDRGLLGAQALVACVAALAVAYAFVAELRSIGGGWVWGLPAPFLLVRLGEASLLLAVVALVMSVLNRPHRRAFGATGVAAMILGMLQLALAVD